MIDSPTNDGDVVRMILPEYVKKLREGKRYVISIGYHDYYMGPVPSQFTGIFVGINEELGYVYFDDVRIHHVPYSKKGIPVKTNGLGKERKGGMVKIPFNKITGKFILPVYPESGEPIEVDSDEDLERNKYVLELSKQRLSSRF